MKILALAREGSHGAAALISKGEVVSVVAAPLAPSPGVAISRDAVEDCLAGSHTDPGELNQVVICGDLERETPFPAFVEPSAELTAPQSRYLRSRLAKIDRPLGEKPMVRVGGWLALAAASYFSAPFPAAAALVFAGSGAGAQVMLFRGRRGMVEPVSRLPRGHSPAVLLQAFGDYLGLTPGRYGYELAYLGAYGSPRHSETLLERLIDLKDDGSFAFKGEGIFLGHPNPHMVAALASKGVIPSKPMEGHDKDTLDLARSALALIRFLVSHISAKALRRIERDRLCLGGDFITELAENQILPTDPPLDSCWVQPLRGAAGLALGAGLASAFASDPGAAKSSHAMAQAHLGAAYSSLNVEGFIRENEIPADNIPPEQISERAATLVQNRQRVGWFQGRDESGNPGSGNRNRLRILGSDSLAGLRDPSEIGSVPAPCTIFVAAEHFGDYFQPEPETSPLSASLLGPRLTHWISGAPRLGKQMAALRGRGPVRVLAVTGESHPQLYRLLHILKVNTGLPLVLAEPLAGGFGHTARSPREAFGLLTENELDVLVIANSVIYKMDDLPRLAEETQRRARPAPLRALTNILRGRWRGLAEAGRHEARRFPGVVRELRSRLRMSPKSYWTNISEGRN